MTAPDDSVRSRPPPALPRVRRRLADDVRDLIAREYILSGAVPPGGLLPSETDLASRYGVSRVTVRASIRSLQEAGLLAARHGVGTVVLSRPRTLTHGLDRLSSLETFAREAGQDVRSEDIEWEEVPADDEMARRLGIPRGHPVLAVRRVKVIGGERVAWILDFVPAGTISFDVMRQSFAGSVLDVLLADATVRVEYADTEIEPESLSPEIATRLGVEPGSAVMFVDAILYAIDGTPLEWARSWLLPAHFRFLVRRRRSYA